MRRMRRRAGMLLTLLLVPAGVAVAQPAGQPAPGPVDRLGEAATQDYVLRLRDAEAKLRGAHERLAAAGTSSPRNGAYTRARQDLLAAAREAWATLGNPPRMLLAHPVQVEAQRRFREGMERLDQGAPDGTEADTARRMLDALSGLRAAAGAPPAAPATDGPAPAEPAARGGPRG